jgi:hypothetical protein
MRNEFVYLKSRGLSYNIISQLSYISLLAEEDDDVLYRENDTYIHIREKQEKRKMKYIVLPFIFVSLYYREQNG